ncbi:MAG: hypothetical protein P8Z00_24985, partial [Anaerolineales bacterium]
RFTQRLFELLQQPDGEPHIPGREVFHTLLCQEVKPPGTTYAVPLFLRIHQAFGFKPGDMVADGDRVNVNGFRQIVDRALVIS